MQTDSTADAALVSARLRELPEFDPDPGLWHRIERARGRALRARRQRRGWIAGALAATLAGVAALPLMQPGQPSVDDATVWQQRSAVLESEWQALQRAPGDLRTRAELMMIDKALQSAYDRGADTTELAPLWKQRSEALRSLINTSDDHQAVAVTRI